MDANGIDDFLKLMGELHGGVNIFIISHRGDTLQDKFDNVLKFQKKSNFSVITVD
jgi:energy-coupling factor transporter ATP-binding protein EcfA2